ncbi:hypothetical protein ACYPKM_05390 [Pseudomonas aeruginosa]
MYFLTIPFSFVGASFRPCDLISGLPAMSGVAGMCYNAQRVFRNELGFQTFTVEAHSLIYFQIDEDGGPPRRPPEEPEKGGMNMPSLMDIRRGHGRAAVILYFTAADDAEFVRLGEMLADRQGMRKISFTLAANLRFVGGEMFIGTKGEFGDQDFGISLHQKWSDTLSRIMQAYPTQGLLIQDMSHELRAKAETDNSTTMQALLNMLYASNTQRSWKAPTPKDPDEPILDQPKIIHQKPEGVEFNNEPWDPFGDVELDLELLDECDEPADESFTEQYLGALMPALTGYHEICDARGEQHFVEAALSLVRGRILPSVLVDLRDHRADWKQHFWCWRHLPSYRMYMTTGYDKANYLEELEQKAQQAAECPLTA